MQRQRAGLTVIRRVHVDDVDVGREVELLGAELAHPDHRQLRVAQHAVVVDVARRSVARPQLAVAERDRLVEARVGEPGQLSTDLGVEPQLELAHPQPDQLVGPDLAQRGLQRRLGRGGGCAAAHLGYENLARLLAPQVWVGRDPDQAVRVTHEQRGEVRRRLTCEGGDPLRCVVQAGDIKPALRRRIEQPLGAAERIRRIGSTHRQVDGLHHRKTIA